MPDLPFDLEHPPEEPPDWVSRPMLWRLAVRLHRDHDLRPAEEPDLRPAEEHDLRPAEMYDPRPAGVAPTCRTCGEPWPCGPRRLAERGLIAACRPPPAQPARPATTWDDPRRSRG
jgi:hypothetical protein